MKNTNILFWRIIVQCRAALQEISPHLEFCSGCTSNRAFAPPLSVSHYQNCTEHLCVFMPTWSDPTPPPHCVASVSHRVSHDSAWLPGSAFPEWQPAGVRSPLSVRSPEPLRTLPLQVSSCCPSASCPSSVDRSCKDKMGSHGRRSPLSFGCGLAVVLVQLFFFASLFLLALSHSPEIV